MLERDFNFDQDAWLCPYCKTMAQGLSCEKCGFKIYAGFSYRFVALLIDNLVMLGFIGFIIFASILLNYLSVPPLFSFCVLSLISILTPLFYNIYLVGKWGQTPGKMLVQIKIVRLNGSQIEWVNAWFRYLVDIVFLIIYVISDYAQILETPQIHSWCQTFESKPFFAAEHLPPILFWWLIIRLAWYFYFWSEVLVLLTNQKRRAIQGFIAATVVIHDPRLPKTWWKSK